jgi:hypothetical protein
MIFAGTDFVNVATANHGDKVAALDAVNRLSA